MSRSGYFITFEGIEGAGKSTQAERLARHLEKEGYSTKVTREPGGTAVGEAIRAVLANPGLDINPLTEVMLLSGSRSQLVDQFIRPQLGEGNIVICDRFSDSTRAYQGYGRGVHPTQIRELTDLCTWGVRPDLTFLLDVDPERGLGRVRTRSVQSLTQMDRLENMDMGFYQRVRDGFLEIAEDEPFRFRVLDGHLEPDELALKIASLAMREIIKNVPHPGRLSFDRKSLE
jgi:dTMP kinase